MWFQPASPLVCSSWQSLKFCRNWPDGLSEATRAMYALYRAVRLG